MKKEEMQAEIERLIGINRELADGNQQLSIENGQLKEELSQAKTASGGGRNDDEWQEKYNTLLAEHELLKKATPAIRTISPRELNQKLLVAVELSCSDHCPHHRNLEACRNCEIGKLLEQITPAGTTGSECTAPDGDRNDNTPNNTGEETHMENIKALSDEQIKERQKCALMLCALVENGIRIGIQVPKFVELGKKAAGYLNALELVFIERHPETAQERNQQFMQACENTIQKKAELEFTGETPELNELFTELESALDEWAETLPTVPGTEDKAE